MNKKVLNHNKYLQEVNNLLQESKNKEEFIKGLGNLTENTDLNFGKEETYYKVFIPFTGRSSVYTHFKTGTSKDAISTSLDINKNKLPRLMLFTLQEIVDLGLIDGCEYEIFIGELEK